MKTWMMVVMFGLFTAPKSEAKNLIMDVRENLVWTFGKTAEVGQGVKIAGGGDLDEGDTTTSFLAGIADYRFLTFSYGGTRINRSDENFTDTMKVGIRLSSFFALFRNEPTPEMSWMKNLNIGPSFAIPLFSRPRSGALFIDINYSFGR